MQDITDLLMSDPDDDECTMHLHALWAYLHAAKSRGLSMCGLMYAFGDQA